jgi:hypothetical protein
MLEMKQLNQASYFYNQLRIFYNYTLNYHGKCRALTGLAECAIQIRASYAAIIFLKRALQYAWATEDVESELYIFSKLALNYFYSGVFMALLTVKE